MVGPRSQAAASVLDRALAEHARTDRVAVLIQPGDARVQEVIDQYADSRQVTVVEAGLPQWLEKARLAAAGPFDLLVDVRGSGQAQVGRFKRSFQHLAPGGTYLVPAPARGRLGSKVPGLGRFLARTDAGASAQNQRQARFAAAVGEVTQTRRALTVVRRGSSLAMMRECEMTEALRVNPARGRSLRELPGAELTRRGEVTSSPYHGDPVVPRPSYTAPPLHLREYHDVVCARRGLVAQRNLLAPDSFRHHMTPVLVHRALLPVGTDFSVPKEDLHEPTSTLAGTYFHLDNEHQGHFGHTLTEQVSRLWALDEARRHFPDLKILLGSKSDEVPAWQLALLAAAGIQADDIVLFREHRRVERLLAATPMFSMPSYVHPGIAAVWDRLGERLREQAPQRAYPRRLFVTRDHGKRTCRNRSEVEELFADHGFEVVLPQEYSLPEQVAMFDQAEAIGGFAGSGLFTTMFSPTPKQVIVVTPTSYRSVNEHLIAAVRGHRLSVVRCRSEIDQPESGRSGAAFNSDFTCDMTREGRWLKSVLSAL